MATTFKVACVQTNSGLEMEPNLVAACELARAAGKAGAELIAQPENVNVMESDKARLKEKVRPEDQDIGLQTFRELARQIGVWLLLGSLVIKRSGDKMANRSFLLDADGAVVARYDKIHMFDVDLGGAETYRESASYEPGDKAVLADLPWGRLGMTICYDLRFPHLYRSLARGGASFFSIPSAFTRITGAAHWHVLQRARAIENGCYVFAPAQCGDHAGGRQTFGHSLIVGPWGEVLADGGEKAGFVTADIDPSKVVEARRKIPALSHHRKFV